MTTIYNKREQTREYINNIAKYCYELYINGNLKPEFRNNVIAGLKTENNSDIPYSEKVRIFNYYFCNKLALRVYQEIAQNTTFYWIQLADFYGFMRSRYSVYQFINKYENKSQTDYNTAKAELNACFVIKGYQDRKIKY